MPNMGSYLRVLAAALALTRVATLPTSIDVLGPHVPSDQRQRQQHLQASFPIPSRYESTVMGRRLLAHSLTGSISTVFPQHRTSPRVPDDVHDAPIALPEYIAACEEPSGNPTILALKVSTTTQNALAGSNVSLAVSWWDEYVRITGKEPWSYANLPRLSLIGYLEEISKHDVKSHNIVDCFTEAHADSKWWLPGDKSSPHAGVWMRLVVEQVYWIGGFGDRAFIGWFDPEEWHEVTVDEYEKVRLPGERSS